MSRLSKARSTVAYVACADERKILVLGFSSEGTDAEVLQEILVPGADGPSVTSMPLALHPKKSFLYAGLRASGFPVVSFAVDPISGRLDLRASGRLADNTVFMKVDRTGRFLMAVSYSGNNIALHRLEGEGAILSTPLSQWETPEKPHSIVLDLTNRSFFVACLGGDVVLKYDFDADKGAVSAAPTGSFATGNGAGPRHQALHPNGRFLFVLNELAASIVVLHLSPAPGMFARIMQVIDLDPAGGGREHAAADIHLTPRGDFLYASERETSMLTGFAVDPDNGTLSRLGAWETETCPRSFGMDLQGRFLIVAGQTSNHVSVYRIESESGLLQGVSRIAMPSNPSWVEVVGLKLYSDN
jgi:6-phosphogluconolactonase